MNRIILTLALGLAVIAPVRPALADDPAPTKEQLEAAKKAFEEGKAAHDAGKLQDAIAKFKESYRLSHNALLLYNIGYTMDEAGQKDEALLYYRKFLSDAPAGAPQRASVSDRVKALEKEKLDADLNGTGPKPDTSKPAQPETKPTKVKPAGTYGAKDFEHQIVDAAPPGKPLDITAYVPQDSGFTVTLFYRGAGEAKFTAKPMRWRYKELVGRIPAAKMSGNSIQYYLEVKDQAGTEVARSGKSTSPNLVNIDAAAAAKFYPDMTDEGDQASAGEITRQDTEDNPLGGNQVTETKPSEGHVDQPAIVTHHPFDVGTKKFEYVKWGSTGATVALLGFSVAFYALAGKQASDLQFDSTHDDNGNPCTAPCRAFDDYDKQLQDAGKRDQVISQITLGVGVAAAAVAGYFWYRELKAKQHHELKVGKASGSPETSWVVAPAVGDHFTGAAAAVRF